MQRLAGKRSPSLPPSCAPTCAFPSPQAPERRPAVLPEAVPQRIHLLRQHPGARPWTGHERPHRGHLPRGPAPFRRSPPLLTRRPAQVPAAKQYSIIFYFGAQSRPPPESAFGKFIDGDDIYRAQRFKLIPSITQGPWMVAKSVGTKPLIVGNALKAAYYQSPSYLEVDIDVGTSSVAQNVCKFVIGYLRSLVIDLAFLVESKSEVSRARGRAGSARPLRRAAGRWEGGAADVAVLSPRSPAPGGPAGEAHREHPHRVRRSGERAPGVAGGLEARGRRAAEPAAGSSVRMLQREFRGRRSAARRAAGTAASAGAGAVTALVITARLPFFQQPGQERRRPAAAAGE